MNPSNSSPSTSRPSPRRRWSIELVLVIALPVAAVVAGLVTLYLAVSHPFLPLPERIDRFGHPLQAPP